MPSQLAHILAGEAAWASARPRPDRPRLPPSPWFNLGCQGPDIFYHNQRTRPSALHFGALAHRRGYGTLVARLVEAWSGLPSGTVKDSLEEYLLGFATHAALDRALHPYIVCRSGWPEPGKPETQAYRGCHAFLERLLDLYLVDRAGRDLRDFDHRRILPLDALEGQSPEAQGLGDLLGKALTLAYPRAGVDDGKLARRMANALADAAQVYELTNPVADFPPHPEYGLEAVALLYPKTALNLLCPYDLGNEAGEEWPHPSGDGRRSRATVVELFQAGVDAGALAIGATAAAMEAAGRLHPKGQLPGTQGVLGAPGLPEAIGDGGLSIADPQGRPCAALVSRPFPLREAMESEFRLRLGGT